MRIYEYEKCGIHSRIQHVINMCGGYDYRMAGELLMREYQLNNRDIAYEMAKNENIRLEIECVGIDAVVELTRKSMLLNKRKLANCVNMINNMVYKTYNHR